MKKITTKGEKKYSHLNLAEREEIAIYLEKGMKQYEIALILKRSPSTISREIRKNISCKYLKQYRANRAQRRADYRKLFKPKRQRIPNKRLKNFICKYLKKGYSPEIIAFMATEHNKRWKTNYESIYQWIYNDRQDLILFLTRSHKKRWKRCTLNKKRCQKIPNRIMINKRPDYINLRSHTGHWEADTVISRQSKAALMILVERCTKFTIIKKLPAKTAFFIHKAIVASRKDPHCNIRSITYDNGTENAFHELTNKTLGCKSYFCNPYHSWEKGTVENIIGVLRRFYPKKTDWKYVTQCDLNKVARFINNRPMKLLSFKTPLQAIALNA
jgi:IS30 family transposase